MAIPARFYAQFCLAGHFACAKKIPFRKSGLQLELHTEWIRLHLNVPFF